MGSELLERVPDEGDEIWCAVKEFTFDKSKDLPGLTTAETQLPSNLTKLDWGWELGSKGRGTLDSPNKSHQIVILGSEKIGTHSRQMPWQL